MRVGFWRQMLLSRRDNSHTLCPLHLLRHRRVPRRPGLSKCEPPWLYKVSPLPTLRPAPLACITDGLFCTGNAPMAAVCQAEQSERAIVAELGAAVLRCTCSSHAAVVENSLFRCIKHNKTHILKTEGFSLTNRFVLF